MRKIILILVFVMMGLSAAARAEAPDWMDPDSPLALGLHPRLLFIPQGYRDTHSDAVGLTVSEMRDKILTNSDYINDFQNLINTMDGIFNDDITSKSKVYATYDAINYAFLYIIDPTVMSQSPYNFTFSHTKDEYGNKAIEHAVYIGDKAKNMTSDGTPSSVLWYDWWTFYYSDSISMPSGSTNLALAIVNDWVNDKVSKTQKHLFIDAIINTYNMRDKLMPFASEKHFGWAQNGDMGILGLYGDDIDNEGETTYKDYSTALLNSVNEDWIKGIIQLGNKVVEGGYGIQGFGYTSAGLKNGMPMLVAMSTALNENYFTKSTFLKYYLPYCYLYFWTPMPLKTGQNTWICIDDMDEKAPITKEWGRYQIENGVIWGLKKDYPDLASLAQWFQNNVRNENNSDNIRIYNALYRLILGNKEIREKSPAELNLPHSIKLGNGGYFLRTGFGNPDGTMIVFLAKKYHSNDGGHAHRNFANFFISKYGDLVTRREIAKGFSDGNIMETQNNMFFNTVGVYNLNEETEIGCKYNIMVYRGGYNNYAIDPNDPAWNENGKNHVGTVLADDLNGIDYDYVDYEYSNSWTPSWRYTQKVDYAERELVYLRSAGGKDDEYVIVFDRINSLNPNYTKYWLLHASFEPRLLDNNHSEVEMIKEDFSNDADGISGGRWVNKSSSQTQNNIIEITNTWNGHGRLFNKTLLPESFQINKIGGPGHYWEDSEGRIIYPGHVAGDSYSKYSGVVDFNTLPQIEKDFYNKYYSGNPGPDGKYYYLTDTEKNYRGTYTMQVQSTTNQTCDHFLNVMQFGDSNTLNQMNSVTRIDGDAMVGVLIKDPVCPRVVMFSQDQKGASVQSVSYKVNYWTALTGRHLLVDMEPGRYDVYKNGVKVHSDLSALDKKGTLYFEANGDSTQEESKESVFQVVRTGEIPAPIVITGDINADNKVDVLDLQLCVNVVLGIETDADRVKKANVNGDGGVDVLDIQAVVNVILNSV